ncbi:MAG: ABC transporter permease [Phycisphaerae bacterium]
MTTDPVNTPRTLEGPPAAEAAGGGRSLWSDAWRRLRRDWVAMLCLAVIFLYALVALGGTVYDLLAENYESIPTFGEMTDYEHRNEPPFQSWRYPLGTDWSGRCIMIKTLLAAKVSMTVGLMANAIAVPVGMVLGSLAGYYGGKTDSFIVWLFSTLASIPGIILLIAMKFAFEDVKVAGLDLTGIHGLYIALGVISWVGTCRLVRAETMKVRELEYVVAARAAGRHNFAILLRHVLPNVSHLGIINFSIGFVGAVKAEVILSYLGLGVETGTPSWGNMISAARFDLVLGRWWEITAAVTAMFFLVLALNIFGDRLRDALDPRLRGI